MPACPCGSDAAHEDCCYPVIHGQSQAATAEALMRSRYSAYATQAIGYLHDSLHPKKRKGHEHAFVVHFVTPQKRDLVVQATSEDERDRWIWALSQHAE